MKVVVLGPGGFIGAKVVDMLTREGEQVVAASRRSGVDVLTGAGLGNRIDGVTPIGETPAPVAEAADDAADETPVEAAAEGEPEGE